LTSFEINSPYAVSDHHSLVFGLADRMSSEQIAQARDLARQFTPRQSPATADWEEGLE
jgi:hypothetical protein